MPDISVIVAAHNSQRTIEECLKAIRRAGPGCELIVVDDGSCDETFSIASKYADHVLKSSVRQGRAHARWRGGQSSRGDIVVNIDSDVIIPEDCFKKISAYFLKHPEYDALTGILSEEHPYPGFFTQYKNLYMHYIFSQLPQDVSFLYGSIYAFRKASVLAHGFETKIADDTALGQHLVTCGKKILFARDLEVIHLKRHTFLSIIRNDLRIPFEWAKIFFVHKSWRHIGRSSMVFAHASKRQITSIVFAVAGLGSLVSLILGPSFFRIWLAASLFISWTALNSGFWRYLYQKRGMFFLVRVVIWTFFDQLLMFAGVSIGFLTVLAVDCKKKLQTVLTKRTFYAERN